MGCIFTPPGPQSVIWVAFRKRGIPKTSKPNFADSEIRPLLYNIYLLVHKRKLVSPSDRSHVRACKGPASKAGRKFKKRFPRIDFEHLRPGPGPGGPKDTQGGLGTHRAGEEAQGSLGGL